jgi:hypothetical protein
MSTASVRRIEQLFQWATRPEGEEGRRVSEAEMNALVEAASQDGQRDVREMNALGYLLTTASMSERASMNWHLIAFFGPRTFIADDAWVARADPRGTPDYPYVRAYSTTPSTLEVTFPNLQAGDAPGVITLQGSVPDEGSHELVLAIGERSVHVPLDGARSAVDVARAIVSQLPAPYGAFADAPDETGAVKVTVFLR